MPPPHLSPSSDHALSGAIGDHRAAMDQDAEPTASLVDDAALLRAFCAEGSQTAFTTVVMRYHAMVSGVCRRILGQGQDADDAVQATFIALSRKASSLRIESSLSPWLYVTAVKSARAVRRAERRRIGHERLAAGSALHDTTVRTSDPAAGLDLDGALEVLSSEQRDAIIMRYLHGHSEEEVARLLGCPVRTLHNRVMRGLTKVREHLSRRGQTAPAMPALIALLAPAMGQALAPGRLAAITREATLQPRPRPMMRHHASGSPGSSLAMPAILTVVGAGLILLIWHHASGTPASQPDPAPVLADVQPRLTPAERPVAHPHPQAWPGHTAPVTGLAFSPAGVLWTCAWDRTVRSWDPRTGAVLATIASTGQGMRDLAISPDGTLLALADADHRVHLRPLAGGDERLLSGHTDEVTAIAFSPDGRRLASVSKDRSIRIWDPQQGILVRTIPGTEISWGLVFAPDGRTLATASDDHAIHTWDVEQGTAGMVFAVPAPAVMRAVVYSPDGRWLAGGGAEGLIRLWDVASGAPVRDLQGHPGMVWSMAVTPDGRRLVSGSHDGSIRVWDTASGDQLQAFTTPPGSCDCVVLSPDQTQVLSAGDDCLIHIWPLQRGPGSGPEGAGPAGTP